MPVEADAAGEAAGGEGGAEERGEFVGADDGDEGGRGKEDKAGRQLDEAAAAGDRVNEACEEGEDAKQEQGDGHWNSIEEGAVFGIGMGIMCKSVGISVWFRESYL